jgi:TRAP transporter TAXI family solute receptor
MTAKPLEISRRAFMLASMVGIAAGCVGVEPDGSWRLAAGEPGGLYYAFAQDFAAQLKSRFPMLNVAVVTTAGSVENLARMRSGDIDIGLAQADVTEREQATGPGGMTAPQAVARLYEDYLQVIVRDSAPIQKLSDLQGMRVSIGPSGSGVAMISDVLFDAAGLGGRVHQLTLRLRDALTGLAAGELDALVWSGGIPTPAIANLSESVPLRMLDLGHLAEPMSRVHGYPYLVRRVAAGGYVTTPGLLSVGVADMLLCRRDVPTDVVGALVDVLASDAPRLMPSSVRGLQYLDPPSMIQTGSIPLHPGAVRAYKTLHG